MSVFRIEIVAILVLLMACTIGGIGVHAARFSYSDIVITLVNPDWKGSPYIIKELNLANSSYDDGGLTYRGFQGQIDPSIIQKYSHYRSSVHDENKWLLTVGSEYDLCLAPRNGEIKLMNKGIFRKEFEIEYVFDISYHSLRNPRYVTSHNEVQFHCKMRLDGIASSNFREKEIKEFMLHRIFALMNEYLRPDEQQSRYLKLRLALAYVLNATGLNKAQEDNLLRDD
jgi:hypothetical protein